MLLRILFVGVGITFNHHLCYIADCTPDGQRKIIMPLQTKVMLLNSSVNWIKNNCLVISHFDLLNSVVFLEFGIFLISMTT